MRYYTATEEWVLIKDGKAYVGLSEHAAQELGDIVYIELPQPGTKFNQGDVFGTVESVKAASDLYLPIGGVVESVNENLEDAPELINENALLNHILVLVDFNEEELKTLQGK